MKNEYLCAVKKMYALCLLLSALVWSLTAYSAEIEREQAALKTNLLVESIDLVDMDEKIEALIHYPEQLRKKAREYRVIAVTTAEPVNLLGAASPQILVRGQAVITRFKPYENTVFYGFIDGEKLDVEKLDFVEEVSLVWPDLGLEDERNALSHKLRE